MKTLIALLLGAFQGVAEWLPISSEGWLYIISVFLLGIDPEKSLTSALFLHLGTSIAAILVLRKELMEILLESRCEKGGELRFFLFSATFATCVVGIPIYIYLKESLLPSFGKILALMTGFLLLAVGFILKLVSSPQTRRSSLSIRSGVFVGVLQGLSVLPGVSRSGITLAALILLGYGKRSLKLSFLLGIPVTLGASLLQIASTDVSMFPSLFSSFLISILFLRALLSFSYRIKPWKLSVLFGLIAIVFSLLLFIS
ncbi:MAG: hypothetical protein DRO00_05575 [Thermoproteota archaeon]|nr:MAG: hypothetical protein DRO00_05575 [Candidatus Korarchaeota archaeon]